MNRYGLRIGNVGVEFPDRQTREKAMLAFCNGSCVTVSDSAGIRYRPGKKTFSTYERDTNEQLMNCSKCDGVFSSEVCSERLVPEADWDGKFKSGNKTERKTLCDGCMTKLLEDHKLWKARQIVEAAENEA